MVAGRSAGKAAQDSAGAPGYDIGLPRVGTDSVEARRADEQVRPAVPVHVAGGADGATVLVTGGGTVEREQRAAVGPGVDIDPAGLRIAATLQRRARGADDNVVRPVAVDVAGVGDGVAVVLAGPADERVNDLAGARRPDIGMSAERTGRVDVERVADDDLGRAVPVEIGQLTGGPTVALPRLTTRHRDEGSWRGRGLRAGGRSSQRERDC